MKIKFFNLTWILLSSYCFILRAGENEDFQLLLLQSHTLKGNEKAEVFVKYAQTHAGKDSAMIALVSQQAALMEEPVGMNVEQVERTLNNIINLNPHSWQAIYARLGILGLMNVDGQHQKLIQYGEVMLAKENFDLFDKDTDPLLLSLKKSFPSTHTMRMAVIEILLVSYENLELFEHLDNKNRIAELQQQLAALQVSNNQHSPAISNQNDIALSSSLNAQPNFKSTSHQPLNIKKQDLKLPVILTGVFLFLLVGVIVFIVIKNHRK
jgi:hypothetical protein